MMMLWFLLVVMAAAANAQYAATPMVSCACAAKCLSSPPPLIRGARYFWPLNKGCRGRDTLPGRGNVELKKVKFDGDVSFGSSSPALFSVPGAYVDVPEDVADVGVRDFSYMVSVYRLSNSDGPLFEWNNPDLATHIWIWQNQFFVRLSFPDCEDKAVFYRGIPAVQNNVWYTVGVTYVAGSKKLIINVNGSPEGVFHSCPSSGPSSDLRSYTGAGINKRVGADYMINGYLTCASLYDQPLDYPEMYQATVPYCKGEV